MSGDQKGTPAVGKLADYSGSNPFAGEEINTGERFVEDNQRCLAGQAGQQLQPCLLAA
ncbi:hypothetical protein D3C81_2283080 [compost metagenome]